MKLECNLYRVRSIYIICFALMLFACQASPTEDLNLLPQETIIPVETQDVLVTQEIPSGVVSTQVTPYQLLIEPQLKVEINPGNVSSLQPSALMSLDLATGFSLSPDNRAVLLASSSQLFVYNLFPLTLDQKYSANNPIKLAISSKPGIFAWSGRNNDLHVIDIMTARELFTHYEFPAGLTSFSFSADGNRLALSNTTGQMKIVNASDGSIERIWEYPWWTSELFFSPDGSSIAGVDLSDFKVHIIDSNDGQESRSLQWLDSASPALYGAIFSPDWQQIAWVSRGTVQLMDANTGEKGLLFSHEDFVNAIAWSPDGTILASAAAGEVEGSFSPIIYLWDTRTGVLLSQIVQAHPIISLAFSSDNRDLAILTQDGILRMWSVRN